MGTTAQKLQAIQNSKAAIKSAIEAKGVSDVGDVLADYATKIGQISGGGSSGDPRYEVSEQGALTKKSFALNYFNNVTSIGNNALEYAYYQNNVTSVQFPNLASVGNYGLNSAFNGCTSLTSVDLSNVTSVGSYGLQSAFNGCTSLTSVDLSSLSQISSDRAMWYTFQGCTSLTSVDLSSLSQISGYQVLEYAFNGCTHLELVDFSQATAVPALSSTSAFNNTNNYYRIVVPNVLYNQWIAATNWSNASIVTHIEKAIKGLVFAAETANSTISLDAVGTPPSLDLEYSTDNGVTFSPYTVGTTVTLANVGDNVMFKAGDNGNTSLATDASNYHKFTMTGSISIEDDISWLLNKNAVPATTQLPDYAFYGLFNGCSALQNAPELPWTTMGEGCYGHMFEGCTALTDAPDLPSTTIDDYCYEGMFKGCTSITTAPSLPATTLATGCYNEMFYGCSALDTISLGYTGNFSTTYFNDWVYGVAASGTFNYAGSDTTTGASAIPSGWTVNDWMHDGLTFRAEQAGSTLKFVKVSSAPTVTVQYTTDGITWNDYTLGSTITLTNVGDRVGFIAKTTNNGFSTSNSAYHVFQGTGQLSVSGNINSLLDRNNYRTITDISTVSNRVFNWMFYGMTSLVSAEDLELPATTIGQFAYNNMFQDCTNMTKAPKEIAATTVNSSNWPMSGMFKGCTSITKSPYLHFTSVNSSNAFQELFQNCSNLNEIKLDYTGNFGTGTWTNWVSGVAASGTFYYNGTYTGRGTNAIPSGWTITPFTA